jgi:hypothetical protein
MKAGDFAATCPEKVMNRMSSALLTVLFTGFAGNLPAAEPVVAIACASPHTPPLGAVGAVTGIDNAAAAWSARESLLRRAWRLCKDPGVGEVRFVPETHVVVEPLRAVAAVATR